MFIRWIAKKLGVPVWFEKTKEIQVEYVDREVKQNVGFFNHKELREVRIEGEKFYSRGEIDRMFIDPERLTAMIKRDVNVKFSEEFEEAVSRITDTTLEESFEGFKYRKRLRFWISEEEYNKLGL